MQPLPPTQMAYDRTIVVFSPDGRLLQVEYAREAVRKGTTCLGVKTGDSVVLGAIKKTTALGVSESHKKIHEIDKHIGLVGSGLLADARDLIQTARVKSQINTMTYGEPISVSSLTNTIADRQHMVTQYAGVRPYGVGFLIAGVDKAGSKLFETDPSGTVVEWVAQAMGRGSDAAKRVLSSGYKPGMKNEDAIKLVLKALKAAEKNVKPGEIEIAVINKKGFKRIVDR